MSRTLQQDRDQEELRGLVRQFLDAEAPVSEARRLLSDAAGYDRTVWHRLATELGLTGITVPEQYGGTGMGTAELGVVLEEMGRTLYTGPYFATAALACPALLHCGDETARERWLPPLVSGETTATLATAEPAVGWDSTPAAQAVAHGSTWRLTGVKTYVPDGHTADLLLVSALCPDGVGLFAVSAGASHLARIKLDTLDPTRPMARIELDGTPCVRISPGDAAESLAAVRDLARAALAAEQVGGAAACLDMAVDYARTREQFGRPIGSFQAVKHKCADMLVRVECARSAARHACAAVDRPGREASAAAAVARAYCSEAYTGAAKENLQIHGGIGFTWEHDAHLFLRRAKTDELLFSSPREERARLAALVDREASAADVSA
ncbi:acyl-CoA dehydrogenase family protein [Streptomyces sp. NPDC102364]|uniref:acyl-CoA dehydrogenase family protein n=1 Tax=Streptomyces sp. NPDC102364 TaxID=3366161 RepID=UPI00380855FD